jgi:hypothetical protein
MPRVFISYARHDRSAIQKLGRILQAHDLIVWRDQESIYGGQQWPKAIEEAIAAHDYVLLVRSKSAAQSHFVEFEWNSAIALRKTIIPCFLDDTPLPPSLRAINAIDVRGMPSFCRSYWCLHHQSPAGPEGLEGPMASGEPPRQDVENAWPLPTPPRALDATGEDLRAHPFHRPGPHGHPPLPGLLVLDAAALAVAEPLGQDVAEGLLPRP